MIHSDSRRQPEDVPSRLAAGLRVRKRAAGRPQQGRTGVGGTEDIVGRWSKKSWIVLNPVYVRRMEAERHAINLARVVYRQRTTGENHEAEIFRLAKYVVELVGTKD